MFRLGMRSIGQSIAANIVPVSGQSISFQAAGTTTFMFLIGMATNVITTIMGINMGEVLGAIVITTDCQPRSSRQPPETRETLFLQRLITAMGPSVAAFSLDASLSQDARQTTDDWHCGVPLVVRLEEGVAGYVSAHEHLRGWSRVGENQSVFRSAVLCSCLRSADADHVANC